MEVEIGAVPWQEAIAEVNLDRIASSAAIMAVDMGRCTNPRGSLGSLTAKSRIAL